MSACLLLDPFQRYLGMSVFFGLSICTATANTGIFLLDYFFGGREDCNKKLGLQVIQRR